MDLIFGLSAIVIGIVIGAGTAILMHGAFFSQGTTRRRKLDPRTPSLPSSPVSRPPPINAAQLTIDRQAERQKRGEVERCLEAAKRGDINAQAMMGTFYYRGEGVEKNTAKAEMWWKMAAQQGHPGAKHNLASMKRSGQG